MSMNSTMRWRAAVLALVAVFSLALAGCNNKSSPAPSTGTTQQPGSGY